MDGEVLIKRPKTKTSFRKVAIPQFLCQKLQQLRESQAEFRSQVGSYWKGDNWIFTQENGTMMNYSTPNHTLRNIIRRFNEGKAPEEQLPAIPFHGLRHTSATLLIASHQDIKTVSSRLGHAQSSTTINIYTHALQNGDRKAADALESLLEQQR